jgi:hypothetical protein
MVTIDVDTLVAAAQALGLAGHRDLAERLLSAGSVGSVGSARADDAGDRLTLALAAAKIAVDDAVWGGTASGSAAVDAFAALLPGSAGEAAWELDLLRLRMSYSAVLAGRSVDDPAALGARARRLLDTAPDEGRAGWAAFYVGVIADNVDEDPATAQAVFQRALDAAGATGDDLLASYALRHLGGHALDGNDLAEARDLLWRSTELRERHGFVPGTLAQRVLLAELLDREGNRAGAEALAADVARAARARGWTRLAAQADDLLARLTT